MRRLNQIVSQSSISTRQYYDEQVLSEYSETQLLNLLASVTKSQGQIQQLIDTFNQYQKTIEESREIEMTMSQQKGFRIMM
jgi:uncharacterized protein YlxW (UPF0749 family)